MNRREELKSFLKSALEDLSKTTLKELRNIETMAAEASSDERSDAFVSYFDLERKLESFPDFKKVKLEIKTAEALLKELRTKYRPEFDKEEADQQKEIKKYWESFFWELKAAKVRKQQINRSKVIKSKKRIEK